MREVSAMEELSNTFATGTSARNKCDSQFILFIHLPHTFRFYNSCQYLPILKRNCLQKRGGGGREGGLKYFSLKKWGGGLLEWGRGAY